MNERVLNTHSKGERVKIPLLPKQGKIKGAGQRQWSRHYSLVSSLFSGKHVTLQVTNRQTERPKD